MADQFGYAVLKSDRASIWLSDGYVSISDGYGTPVFDTVPSGIVKSVVRNDVGNYSIILQQAWYALVSASVQTVVPAGTLLVAQVESFTVGDTSVQPISAGGVGQQITFQVADAAGSAAELPEDSGFLFSLRLKQTSA